MAVTFAPSAFAKRRPKLPRPPIPTIPTSFAVLPAPYVVKGLYKVAPPPENKGSIRAHYYYGLYSHNMGAANAGSRPSGILKTNFPGDLRNVGSAYWHSRDWLVHHHIPVVVGVSSVALVALGGALFVELAVVRSDHLRAILPDVGAWISLDSRPSDGQRARPTLGLFGMHRNTRHSYHTARRHRQCRLL